MGRPFAFPPRSAAGDRLTLLTLADPSKVFPGVNPRTMPIAPVDADGIISHWLNTQDLQRWFIHLEGVVCFRLPRWRSVRSGASGAGALVPQVRQPILAMMAILPINMNSLGFGNGDMFRIGRKRHFYFNSRSTSRTPEIRRIAPTSFSSCFLSRTSTVISTTPPS
jgi:hypothetical protein